MWKTLCFPSIIGVDNVAFRSYQNPVNSGSWHSCWLYLSELPKSCQQWELTFLSIVAFRATKIPTILRAGVSVGFRATKNLEDSMLPVNYRSWQRSFSELPNSYQQWGLTFLLIAAFRSTKNLEDTMLPVNYQGWQHSFSELPKFCHQWELTFLSTVDFIAIKIPTTLRVDVPVASRVT